MALKDAGAEHVPSDFHEQGGSEKYRQKTLEGTEDEGKHNVSWISFGTFALFTI